MSVIIILLLIVNLIITFAIYHNLSKNDNNDRERKVVQKISGNGNVQSVNTIRVDYKEKKLAKIKSNKNLANDKEK
jgi:uncharacterized protein YpmB